MNKTAGGGWRRHLTYSNVISTLALFLVIAGGTAIAAGIPKNSVSSKTVKNGSLASLDLKDGKGVQGVDVVDGSLTGTDIADGSLGSADIADGAIANADIADKAVNSAKVLNNSLKGDDVADNSLGGASINEAGLGPVPNALNAGQLEGRPASSFLPSTIYRRESAAEEGTTNGADETQTIELGCDPGDVLLSGGPTSIEATTTLLESTPSPTPNTWLVRVNKNGHEDAFGVAVLCTTRGPIP
jgi:hypothetical protein